MARVEKYEVVVGLSVEEQRLLGELIRQGYGVDRAEVVRYLMIRELDDLRRHGVLPSVEIQVER